MICFSITDLPAGVNYSARRAALAPLTVKFAPEPALGPIPEPPRVSAPMHTAGPMVLGAISFGLRESLGVLERLKAVGLV